MRLERTRADARHSFKMYAADMDILRALTPNAALKWVELMAECAVSKSDTLLIAMANEHQREILEEIKGAGLIEFTVDGWKLKGFSQRLNTAAQLRSARSNEKRRKKQIQAWCDEIIKNPKPKGVPDEAIVWGGNEKRWGTAEDVQLAHAIYKNVSKRNDQFKFGITLINQCRLLKDQFGVNHTETIGLFNAIHRAFEKGRKVTVNNLREVLEHEGL